MSGAEAPFRQAAEVAALRAECALKNDGVHSSIRHGSEELLQRQRCSVRPACGDVGATAAEGWQTRRQPAGNSLSVRAEYCLRASTHNGGC